MKAQTAHQEIRTDVITLSPTEAKQLLMDTYQSGKFLRTILLKGAPGIGKTSITRQAAKELALSIPGFDYIEINPTMPADEVCGIPDLIRTEGQTTKTDYALPVWFPTDPEWKGIICLDDALQGDRMMQQTLANFILARNLRGHALPEGAMIVATGNRLEDKAGVTKTLTHLADRMCHINVDADPEAWIDDFAIPKNIDQRIIAYIHMDKAKLNAFNPNSEKCPTSRTWAAVSDWLAVLDKVPSGTRHKLSQAVLAGELGTGEAINFWAFVSRFNEMPNLDDIIKAPATHSIDYTMDLKYAIAVALANKVDNTNFGAALEYCDRLTADMVVLLVKLAVKRSPALSKSKAWMDWAVKNQSITIATGAKR